MRRGLLSDGAQAAAGHQSIGEGGALLAALRLRGGQWGSNTTPTAYTTSAHPYTHNPHTVLSAPRKGAI